MVEEHRTTKHLIEILTNIALQQKNPDQAASVGISHLSDFLQELNYPYSQIWLKERNETLRKIAITEEIDPFTGKTDIQQQKEFESQWLGEQANEGFHAKVINGLHTEFFPFTDENKMNWGGVLIANNEKLFQKHLEASDRLILRKICSILGESLHLQMKIIQELYKPDLELNQDHVLQKIYLQMKTWFQADYFFVALLDSTEKLIEIKYSVKDDKENTADTKKVLIPIDSTTSISADVIRSKKSRFINNISEDASLLPIHYIDSKDNPQSMLFVPLEYNNQIKGVISIQKEMPNGFHQEDLMLFEQLAVQIAMTLEIQGLYNREIVRRSETETLNILASQFSRFGNDKAKVLNATSKAIFNLVPSIVTVTMLAKTTNNNELVCIAIDNRSNAKSIMGVGSQYTISWKDERGLGIEEPKFLKQYPNRTVINLIEAGNATPVFDNTDISSIYTFGMESNGSIDGYIVLTWITQNYVLPENKISVIQNVANQTAIALDRIKFSEAERKQYQLARTLRDMGLYLTIDLSISEFYDRLFDLLSKVVDYDSASLYLKNSETGQYTLFSNRNIQTSSVENLTHDEIVGVSLARFENDLLVCCIPNTIHDKSWIDHSTIKSWVGALIRIKGEVIGLLNVNSFETNTYDNDITSTILAFANHASIALESSRLYEKLEQRIDELSVINQFTKEAAHSKSIAQLINSASQTIYHQQPDALFGIGLIEDKKTFIHTWSVSSSEKVKALTSSLSFHEGIVGRAIRTKKPQFVNDVRLDPDYLEIYAKTLSQISVPLLGTTNKAIGILSLESPRLNAFSNNDLVFITTLADQISGSIQRLQLHHKLQKHAVNLEEEVHRHTVELREERDRIEKILQNAGEGIFFTDIHQNVIYTNEALRNETGFSNDELLGFSPELFISPPTDNFFDEIFSKTTSLSPYRENLLGKRKNKSEFWVNCIITPIFDDRSVLTGHVGIIANIDSLIQAEQIKSRFITNISHELRTPLTNIKVYLDLIKRGVSEKTPRYMSILDTEVKRLEGLIQDLLGLSIIDSGSLKLHPVLMTLKVITRERIDGWQKRFEDAEIDFSFIEPETGVYALFDPAQIISVRDHMLSNALNYSTKGDAVILSIGSSTHKNKKMAFMTVSDTGMGMTPRETGLIFDRFFRGDEALTRQIAGAGLGLSVAKEIIARHNGDITVHSNPQKGSSFTAFLPVQ